MNVCRTVIRLPFMALVSVSRDVEAPDSTLPFLNHRYRTVVAALAAGLENLGAVSPTLLPTLVIPVLDPNELTQDAS